MKIDGMIPMSIPEEGEGKKKKKSAQVAEAPPEVVQEELKKAGKKKGHVYKKLDVFKPDAPRERAKSADPSMQRPDGPAAASSKTARTAQSLSAQEARERLLAIAEEKMQAVEREDFELAERLKHEEKSLRHLTAGSSFGSSWADIAGSSAAKPSSGPTLTVAQRGRKLWQQSLAAGGLGFPRATSEGPRAASASVGPGQRQTGSVADDVPAETGQAAARRGGLAFFLPAPGELTAETFKPTTTHVSRRDALARITSAALYRGRGAAWESTAEVAFLFEDNQLMRLFPRFTTSCPVPSEFQLISVLNRAIEKGNVLGSKVLRPNSGKPFGGHVERVIGEYAKAGRTAVVMLHESYPLNLGIYTTASEDDGPADGEEDDRTLIFFLGAVKDMTNEETKAVQRACKLYNVPCVEANLGQQAEFTSKIVDVLHGHHLFRRLMPAAWTCARRRCGSMEGIGLSGPKPHQPPRGLFWVFIPMGGGPGELTIDDKKKDGMYEIPRSCISQLWCSKGEHRGHIVSFVFAGGEVLTVYATLVTCLKTQHRAAPTERNLVNALKVGIGDQRADPSLSIDEGCVTLGDVTELGSNKVDLKVDRQRTALVDFTMGGDGLINGPRLSPYTLHDEQGPDSRRDVPRDVVALLHQAGGRDFPRGFREKLVKALLGESGGAGDGVKGEQSRLRRMSVPAMSVNATISLLVHYRQTGTLGSALATTSTRESKQDAAGKAKTQFPKGTPQVLRRPSANEPPR